MLTTRQLSLGSRHKGGAIGELFFLPYTEGAGSFFVQLSHPGLDHMTERVYAAVYCSGRAAEPAEGVRCGMPSPAWLRESAVWSLGGHGPSRMCRHLSNACLGWLVRFFPELPACRHQRATTGPAGTLPAVALDEWKPA